MASTKPSPEADPSPIIPPHVRELATALQALWVASDESIIPWDVEFPIDLSDLEVVGMLVELTNESDISMTAPGEVDSVDIPIPLLLQWCRELGTLRKIDSSSVATRSTFSLLVQPVNEAAHAAIYHGVHLECETSSGASVRIRHDSLLVAVVACKEGAYLDDGLGAISSYTCVEVDFGDTSSGFSPSLARDFADSFLFELASRHGLVFDVAHFLDTEEIFTLEGASGPATVQLRELERPNDGIRLYVAAMQVTDASLRFFSFFKVLEFFGPVVLNMAANDALCKKLDTAQAVRPNGPFLREVFQLAKNFDTKRNEKDLMKLVLRSGTDLVGLTTLLPAKMRAPITHETAERDLDQHARELAEILCSTRNHVAHAKSAYPPTGKECDPADLSSLTSFLEAAAAQTIRWYNRLPEHQRNLDLL